MSEDLDLLRRAVEEPVAGMILAEAVSPSHTHDLTQQVREWIGPLRSVQVLGFDANKDDASVLWERCRDAVTAWDEEPPGLLLVRDDSPSHVRIAHSETDKPTSIGFWRTMNQLREKWDALPSQTVFLVTREQYFFLTTEADHFKRWIPLKLHLPGPEEPAPRRLAATSSRASDESLTAQLLLDDLDDQEAAQQNWEAYQERLRQAHKRDESARALARRYYLPLMAAAIALQKWMEAANYNARINSGELSTSQRLRWLRLRSRLEEAQGDIDQAVATAEERLRLAEELEAERAKEGRGQQEPSRNILSALLELFVLHWRQNNLDEAERWILQGLKLAPEDYVLLGNYASFLYEGRRDYKKAQELYLQVLEANLDNAVNLGNYASLLETALHEYDKAEQMYLRAIKAEPKRASILSNYANFLSVVRQDDDKAERLYEQAIEADPRRAKTLGNYATFLRNKRHDYEKADRFYHRAIEADPKNAINLGNYAIFLCLTRGDYIQAGIYFRRTMKAAPDDPQCIINYAALLLMQGQRDEGKAELERAAAMSVLSDAQQVGISFHCYIHFPREMPSPLKKLKRILKAGKRAPEWNFDGNIERAQQDGHPNVPLLKALADVVRDEKKLKSLDVFREWRVA